MLQYFALMVCWLWIRLLPELDVCSESFADTSGDGIRYATSDAH